MAAIDDLNTAINDLSDSISVEMAALAAALAKPDDTAGIQAAVAKINDLNSKLKASVTPAPTA
jgi:DNA-binding FadR family transcriptional regulator